MDVCKRIIINGRVQGVFFRESTRQQAVALKLVGGVRNIRDGRVEVQVSGKDEAVRRLINWLKIGPKYAKVSTIEVAMIKEISLLPDGESEQDIKSFTVWPNRV